MSQLLKRSQFALLISLFLALMVSSPLHAADGINVNTATAEVLESLPSIGPAKAKAIVDYREENGAFTAINQVQNVPGIGSVTYEKIKDLIVVGKP